MALNFHHRKRKPAEVIACCLQANPGHYEETPEKGPRGETVLRCCICEEYLVLHQPAVKTLSNHSQSKKHQRNLQQKNARVSDAEQIPVWQTIADEQMDGPAKLKVCSNGISICHWVSNSQPPRAQTTEPTHVNPTVAFQTSIVDFVHCFTKAPQAPSQFDPLQQLQTLRVMPPSNGSTPQVSP
jgi:hypothetical protein